MINANNRLMVGVLGRPGSGKSLTFTDLFDEAIEEDLQVIHCTLKCGSRSVQVYVVPGSPEEIGIHIQEILSELDPLPRIVLCAIQHKREAKETLRYFAKNRYDMYVQQLKPGHSYVNGYTDRFGLIEFLTKQDAEIREWRGDEPVVKRTKEIRDYICRWVEKHGFDD